jgi:ribosomal protein S18 acetylase RimI-like enzyme
VKHVAVRPLADEDREWAAEQIKEQWGSRMIVSKGKVYYPHQLQGFIAFQDGERIGLATYNFDDGDCELVTIHTLRESQGAGSALLDAVRSAAERAGCKRLWLITTNDNLRALGFYQKRGLRLVAVYRNAMDEVRKLKPMVPLIGKNGIPLRDEIELEIIL